MDTVNGICGNVYRTLETKGHVCAIDVIINSLWNTHEFDVTVDKNTIIG